MICPKLPTVTKFPGSAHASTFVICGDQWNYRNSHGGQLKYSDSEDLIPTSTVQVLKKEDSISAA